jgi:hypothetical protein
MPRYWARPSAQMPQRRHARSIQTPSANSTSEIAIRSSVYHAGCWMEMMLSN